MDQTVMYKLTYGLFVLTAKEGEKDNGCIVNTVSQVTVTPNRIAVAVNKESYTHDMIVRTGVFNKAAGITFSRAENGVIYLAEETNAYLSAKVVTMTDLGTHTLFLADVTGGAVLSQDASVTYAYYQANIKPAPDTKEKKKGFICTVCGYIYEGETLPEDYICPLCKHPASDFVPL